MAPADDLTVDQRDFVAFTRAMRAEADGKALRRDLIRSIRVEIRPAQAEVKAAVLALPSTGGPRIGKPLRQAVASQVRTSVRLSGRSAGASIKVKKHNMPRGFQNAPRRLNRPHGWRHSVYGREDQPWVTQTVSPSGWFDNTLRPRREGQRRAILAAVERMAARIVARANRGS